MRLLKNREAARECRRKKKDYVKCLENRVAVLENQNKALIEELKSLKDLYCNKQDWLSWRKRNDDDNHFMAVTIVDLFRNNKMGFLNVN